MKIGIDIDEVLASFVAALFDYHNKTRGTHFDKREIKSNFFSDYVKFSKEETSDFLDEFFNSDANQYVEPVFGSIEAIKSLDKFELIAITIRPHHWQKQTGDWLVKNFGKAFKDLYMLGKEGSSEGGVLKSKEELAVELGINIFIEDSLSTAKKLSEKGIPVILLDKPWNQGETSENVYRVKTWEEVLEKINIFI